VANPENPEANIVAVEYRYGGGRKGNVAAGQLSNLPGGVAGVDTSKVSNLLPAAGGRDEETVKEAKQRAPQQLKNKDRAVTEEDFESLASLAPGVKRAKALALAHPGFPNVQVPGAVTVIIVPDGDGPNPSPSENLIRTVCEFLNQRRLLTTELFVVPPRYHKASVRSQVIAEGNADLAEVKKAVEERLLDYLHPLKGGEKQTGWVFGGDVFFSLIYRQILNVPGVLRIENLFITLDGIEQLPCQDVPIPPGELVYSNEHTVEVIYEIRE
jgi:predicted phage baseplate assembly protein